MPDDVLVPAKKIDAAHLRMARVGVNLSIRELAQLADINKATIVRMEAGYPVRESSLLAVRDILENKGAVFWKYKKMNQIVIGLNEV
jgi:DNA-binding XRE family transcriptional regulator